MKTVLSSVNGVVENIFSSNWYYYIMSWESVYHYMTPLAISSHISIIGIGSSQTLSIEHLFCVYYEVILTSANLWCCEAPLLTIEHPEFEEPHDYHQHTTNHYWTPGHPLTTASP